MSTTTITTASTGNPLTGIEAAALLRLMWLASPALPVGGFSYSEGLEAAVEAGLVQDEATAGDWIADQLHLTLARSDLAVLAAALAAGDDTARIDELDAWVRATRETSELRQQTEQMGRSLAEWRKSLRPEAPPTPAPDRCYPVAFALAASASGASPRDILLCYAFGWSENMMQSAIKAVPLGQGAGQRILARLAGEIPVAVDDALSRDDATRQSFSPMLAILSAQHETQYSRLFRS